MMPPRAAGRSDTSQWCRRCYRAPSNHGYGGNRIQLDGKSGPSLWSTSICPTTTIPIAEWSSR